MKDHFLAIKKQTNKPTQPIQMSYVFAVYAVEYS